ncbi:hypothetical protein HanXRQr2_Chr08g0326751 [Helianthus annuus]|uniref:Uncharacterized protein n=1 Tax=Helianthus annuus TaxID=4232 RepID=A0A9K3ICD9_HELAN|nr:hypothetical protein HanXRQr2_Chr08g0326751 [Helianthus annuus]
MAGISGNFTKTRIFSHIQNSKLSDPSSSLISWLFDSGLHIHVVK